MEMAHNLNSHVVFVVFGGRDFEADPDVPGQLL
jgi:hypothetical protein